MKRKRQVSAKVAKWFSVNEQVKEEMTVVAKWRSVNEQVKEEMTVL